MAKERRPRVDEEHRKRDAEYVAETMGQMKGVAMKLGQMLSFVTETVPAEYRAALVPLQTSAPPMHFDRVRDVIERELNLPLERVFARFDSVPLAAASIGQVHFAILATGEHVAVKVQYPGVAEAIRADLVGVSAFRRLCSFLLPGANADDIVDEIRARLLAELDYFQEAKNQDSFYQLYLDHPFIRIPRVISPYCTSRVLTSEFIQGRSLSDVTSLDPESRSRYGEILYRFAFGSIFCFCGFNADPHPGNYLFDDDNRVVFLDFGCVKYFPPGTIDCWKEVMGAHLMGKKQEFRDKLVDLGFLSAQTHLNLDLVFDFSEYLYKPFAMDQAFTFTRDYTDRSFQSFFYPEERFGSVLRELKMPADFVLTNRIQWGIYSILADLKATANWHRIQGEWLFSDYPSTKLGRIDLQYRRSWLKKHGIDNARIVLTASGLRIAG